MTPVMCTTTVRMGIDNVEVVKMVFKIVEVVKMMFKTVEVTMMVYNNLRSNIPHSLSQLGPARAAGHLLMQM